MRRSTCFLLAAVVYGCGASSPASRWEVSVDTLASGASHVVNVPAADTETEWTLRETLRVGTLDGGGPASFGDLRGLAVFDDGRFAVLDALVQEVRVFGRDGDHIATYGGRGAGPSEFEAAFGLMRHPDGTLWVPDHRNARMSVFDPDRGFQKAYPLRVRTRAPIWRGAMLRDGRVWKPSLLLDRPTRRVMRVYGPDMTLMDSLPLPTDPEVAPEDLPGNFFWRAADGRSNGYHAVPFYPVSQQLIDPEGAVWSTTGGDPSYRIALWQPGGDTTLVLETIRPLVEIPTMERDSAISAIREDLRKRGAGTPDWSKVPRVRPAIAMMFVAEEGELWVLTKLADSEVFDVYSRDGRHGRTVLNSLNLYPWLRPVVIGEELWAVVTDDLDVHYVVRASIERVVADR